MTEIKRPPMNVETDKTLTRHFFMRCLFFRSFIPEIGLIHFHCNSLWEKDVVDKFLAFLQSTKQLSQRGGQNRGKSKSVLIPNKQRKGKIWTFSMSNGRESTEKIVQQGIMGFCQLCFTVNGLIHFESFLQRQDCERNGWFSEKSQADKDGIMFLSK